MGAYDRYIREMQENRRTATDSPFNGSSGLSCGSGWRPVPRPSGMRKQTTTATVAKDPVMQGDQSVVAFDFFFRSSFDWRAAGVSRRSDCTLCNESRDDGCVGLRVSQCGECGHDYVLFAELCDSLRGVSYHNTIDELDTVMVTFTLSSEVLYILANNYPCSLSEESAKANTCFAPMPATNSGSGFRYSLGTGENEVAPALKAGTYRMHCPVSMTDNYLTVERDAEPEDEPCVIPYRISEYVVSGDGKPLGNLSVPHGKIAFDIFPDTRSFFVLWIQENLEDEILLRLPEEERAAYTSASEVLNHPSFHLFEDQIVPSGTPSLSLRNVVLVFTDIVGSTELYRELGDGRRFNWCTNTFAICSRPLPPEGEWSRPSATLSWPPLSQGRTRLRR